MPSDLPKIEINRPRLFTNSTVVIVSAFGLVPILPIFLSIVVVSLIKLSVLTLLIPLGALATTACFLPFGLGNTYITRLVRSLNPVAGAKGDGFIVQLTLAPRLRSGVRALLEDADDIGYLTLTAEGLCFQGDSVRLSMPWGNVCLVRFQNIGWRGLFVYGQRIKLVASGWPEVESFEFAERSSWLLPTSRATTKKMHEQLSIFVPSKTS
jgi:hypothetical protein